MKSISSHMFLFANDCRPIARRGGEGHRVKRYGRGLLSKPAISLKKSRGGYRRITRLFRSSSDSTSSPRGDESNSPQHSEDSTRAHT